MWCQAANNSVHVYCVLNARPNIGHERQALTRQFRRRKRAHTKKLAIKVQCCTTTPDRHKEREKTGRSYVVKLKALQPRLGHACSSAHGLPLQSDGTGHCTMPLRG